jgi:outer membrane murein-binding lipoprotein Lpp
MARPKGSKNKARTVKASVDYVAVIAEKAAKKEKIESEVATLTANLDDLKTQLKAKKAELKAATKELAKAENKKLPPKQKQQKKQRRAKQKMC